MGVSIWQIGIVVILVVLLFGRGKISSLMGDLAKGIKSFKKGMSTDISDEASTDLKDDADPKNISNDNSDPEQK
tara:strand:+ start:111 stop:332 length:222 start_codon:yes stop_codon:yes gene_type:complete